MGVCIGVCIEVCIKVCTGVCIGGVEHAPFHELPTPTISVNYRTNSFIQTVSKGHRRKTFWYNVLSPRVYRATHLDGE